MGLGFKPDTGEVGITASMKECISKAINPKEKPIKKEDAIKVVALAFISPLGMTDFWTHFNSGKHLVLVYWKYFQLLHIIMLENHPTVLSLSYQHKDLIKRYGAYWSNSGRLASSTSADYAVQHHSANPSTTYGPLLKSYSNVLLMKLDFHHSNRNMPGSLDMDNESFVLLMNNLDVDSLLEMLNDTITYWSTIKHFLMELLQVTHIKPKEAFQCKFQPFLFCMEEVKHLYRYSKMILFKLRTGYSHVNIDKIVKLFKIFYEAQCGICEEASKLEWIPTLIDLTFIKNREVPEIMRVQTLEDKNKAQETPPQTTQPDSNKPAVPVSRSQSFPLSPPAPSQVKQPNHIPAGIVRQHSSALESQLQLLNRVLPPPPVPPHRVIQPDPSAPPYSLVSTSGKNQPSVQANGVSSLAQTTPDSERSAKPRTIPPAQVSDTTALSRLESRVKELEMEMQQKSQTINNVLETNSQLTATNKNLTTRNENLEAELKQLKINSGRQFCQLHATIREKDKIIKGLKAKIN